MCGYDPLELTDGLNAVLRLYFIRVRVCVYILSLASNEATFDSPV